MLTAQSLTSFIEVLFNILQKQNSMVPFSFSIRMLKGKSPPIVALLRLTVGKLHRFHPQSMRPQIQGEDRNLDTELDPCCVHAFPLAASPKRHRQSGSTKSLKGDCILPNINRTEANAFHSQIYFRVEVNTNKSS